MHDNPIHWSAAADTSKLYNTFPSFFYFSAIYRDYIGEGVGIVDPNPGILVGYLIFFLQALIRIKFFWNKPIQTLPEQLDPDRWIQNSL